MKLLNVLLVAYSFPPAGGVGVLRAASLARYLPAEGIRLDVLTARNASAVGADAALLKQIPAEVFVHRTVTLDLPFGIKKWIKKLIAGRNSSNDAAAADPAAKPNFLKRALQDILLPDPQVTWLPVLTRAARGIVRKRKIDLVLITVPPFSSVLLVERLRAEFPRLPIVVDFRDEWISTTIGLVSFSRSERAWQVARSAEASAVTNATAIVAVTEAARREIRSRYPQEPEGKFHLIPNGFDVARMPLADPRRGNRGDRILIVYAGSIYGSTEPTWLVQALQSLPDEVKARFRLRFIGHIEEPRFREALLQLGEMVEFMGFLPHDEAMAAIGEADYALLITHDPLNVAAKFYDYAGAGKPILATVHPGGEVRRLLEEMRAGWWVGSRDVEAIRQLFVEAAVRADALCNEFHPDTGKVAQYERGVLAQRYAALLKSIAANQRECDSQALAAQLARSGEQHCSRSRSSAGIFQARRSPRRAGRPIRFCRFFPARPTCGSSIPTQVIRLCSGRAVEGTTNSTPPIALPV
jgi:glycosyltransferase involved in cell wall biosynthesis